MISYEAFSWTLLLVESCFVKELQKKKKNKNGLNYLI